MMMKIVVAATVYTLELTIMVWIQDQDSVDDKPGVAQDT